MGHFNRGQLATAQHRHGDSPPWIALWLLLALLFFIPGCGGCTSNKGLDREAAAEARKKAEEERRLREKEPFILGELRVQPNNQGRERDAIERSIKPGHWTSATLMATANQGDFSGHLASQPLDLPEVPFRLSSTRPLVLSKAQPKTIDTLFFVPVGYSQRQFNTRLLSRRGSEILTSGDPLVVIPAHQFFFVVLASEPDRYAFLRDLDFAMAPSGFLQVTDAHYRVVLPRVRTRAPLSPNPLVWTNIAYVLWDNQDPSTLTLDQQAALVDWLHWGGQLIVSGPDSFSSLKGSFLEPYLPATDGGSLEMPAEFFASLARETSKDGTPLAISSPWNGVKLVPGPESLVVVPGKDDAPLVVERRVGNGRVVLTAFRLARRELVAWGGIDAFVNRYLLRRPARLFSAVEGELAIDWLDNADWQDSTRSSRLRFFSRDAQMPGVAATKAPPPPLDQAELSKVPSTDPWNNIDPRQDPNFDSAKVPRSVAAWNDHSDVANMARKAVRDATRIEIPQASFVVRMLALYLLVLVPLNWLVFRSIGRVEWAWVAAPLIALLGAVVVVRAAQLDIGFARAKNELATLELFAGHPRGHLTRYTSLYTSLSTDYELSYSDPTALAHPFPLGVEQLYGQTRSDVDLRRGENIELRPLPVSSNSVGIVHGEQMFDLGGTLTLVPDPQRPEAWQIVNGTRLTLEGAGVLQPGGAAWIGTLKPGESAPLEFNLSIGGEAWEKHRASAPETAPDPTPGSTHLAPLIQLAEVERQAGEWRLVAWTQEELSGVTITPRAPQSRDATVVVAHLRPGEIPLGVADRSSRAQVDASLDSRRVHKEDPQ